MTTAPSRHELDGTDLRDRLIRLEPAAAKRPDAIRLVRAPARVNLIGEHTDYNDGLVLPAAINLEIRVVLVPMDDDRVELTLAATGERGVLDLRDIGPRRGTWLDYVAGTAWALRDAGVPIRGFRGLLDSTIPPGAGLSSSAALELATAWALAGGKAPALEPMTLAQTAQRAENAYGSALLLDCRSLAWRPVPIPAEVEIVVCHSGSPRRLEASAYNARRAECNRAVAALGAHDPGVVALRDVNLPMLERHRAEMDQVAYARALHVVTENARVVAAEAALQTGDLDEVASLFAASHASLRDRFEVSSEALDALVEIALGTPGVVAARLTGAGFGGCTVNLVERGRADQLRAAVERDYPTRTGLTPRVFVVDAADGVGTLTPGAA
ncbi:MAG: galactokinase [Chloroflexi bacterium]|nr:galactokinase [Chloroflexota bacterium]